MPHKVLTVDDDPMVRNITRAILESAGFEVLSAADGREALALIDSESRPLTFHCIITDVQMPEVNGYDLLTRLKVNADTQKIPVIMLTCQSDSESLMAGYSVGADYYITKPFTREQLLYGVKLVTE